MGRHISAKLNALCGAQRHSPELALQLRPRLLRAAHEQVLDGIERGLQRRNLDRSSSMVGARARAACIAESFGHRRLPPGPSEAE
jgi:hypothetical protein